MAPTILIVGATGNTGKGVVDNLPQLLQKSKTLTHHKIIALTRSAASPAAQAITQIPGIEVEEQAWSEITPAWLRERDVERVFIASHNEPTQFSEESTFLVAALRAGVQYVVRISTTAANVFPDNDAYYPRTHWAIEAMLETPEFEALGWTSLQPMVFTAYIAGPAAQFIKGYRETGKQGTLALMCSGDAPAASIDPEEVGRFAANLLAEDDPRKHYRAKYVLNGPEDYTGEDVVRMVEGHIGEKVKDVKFKDVSFVEHMAEASNYSKNVIRSIKYAPVTSWEGKTMAAGTSKEVIEIAPPERTVAETLEALLKA